MIRVAIECRDKARPVTVNEVEGYAAKSSNCNVDKAAIVSSTGFASGALKKASKRNIIFLSPTQSKSYDWLGNTNTRLSPGRRWLTDILDRIRSL